MTYNVTKLLGWYPNSVVSNFNIDVNSTDTIIHVNDPDTTGLNAPLHNIINAWAADSYVAGTFALDIITFFIAAGACACVYLYASRGVLRHYFGLRVALLLFTISRFFAWLYQAIANTQAVTRGYTLFWMVPSGFQVASDILLLYTLARTVCQPLVVATGYTRARGVGLGFSLSYAVIAAADWVFMLVLQGLNIQRSWAGYYASMRAAGGFLTSLILGAVGLLWGFVFFGLAVRAMRQTRGRLSASLRTVPKLAMGAATLWTLRAGVATVNSVGIWNSLRGSYPEYSVTPLVAAVVVDLGGLGLFALLFACYREKMAALYDGYMANVGSETELGQAYGTGIRKGDASSM